MRTNTRRLILAALAASPGLAVHAAEVVLELFPYTLAGRIVDYGNVAYDASRRMKRYATNGTVIGLSAEDGNGNVYSGLLTSGAETVVQAGIMPCMLCPEGRCSQACPVRRLPPLRPRLSRVRDCLVERPREGAYVGSDWKVSICSGTVGE